MKNFIIILLMAWSCNAYAQTSITLKGSIIDAQTRAGLSGATVKIGVRIFVTDSSGSFSIADFPKGEYDVEVKFVGYATIKKAISAYQDETILLFELQESATLTDEVVVFATRASEKTPTTFTDVSKQTLQKQNFGQDMPFILNWTPSVVTTSDAGAGVGYTGIRIRGSDATRINVTINGIPYNDSESQSTYWVNIPDIVSSTQSVQVQRGVGTSTNGAGSFGGSVNLQTLSLQQDPYAEVTVSGGSFNTGRATVQAGTGLLNNHWSFDGRVSKITSDGYIDRASSDLGSYYLSAGYHGEKTIIKAITFGGHEITYQSWNGIDGETMKTNRTFNSCGALYDESWNVIGYYDNQVDDYKQTHYQLHVSQQLSKHWNGTASLHYTYGRGFYEVYEQAKPFGELGLDDIVLKDTTLTYGDFVVRKWLDNKFYGTTFSFNYEKGKTLLTLGGAYNQYAHAKHFGELVWAQYAGNSTPGQHYYEGESQKNDFNIYAKWNYKFSERWNGFADIQYRTIKYNTAGTDSDQVPYDISDSFQFVNPKAGVSYTASASDVLYASYAVANREPNRTDYLDGLVKPKSERLGNLEIGWRRNTQRYSVETNYYWMNYTNQLVLTGQLDDVGNPIRANVGKSFRTGIEVSGMWWITDALQWNANATWSVNRNVDYIVDEVDLENTQNTSIIMSPAWIAGSQLSWNVLPALQASLLSKYVGEQYLDNTQRESLKLDAYFVNDIRLQYSIKKEKQPSLTVSLLVNNIFNELYESNGYSYDGVAYYYPQAGRNFLLMVSVRL
jgi:iron complex outermembrane receptor protein